MKREPRDVICRLVQECIRNTPVIILGSGASAQYGIPGMPHLKTHLLALPCPPSAKQTRYRNGMNFMHDSKLQTLKLR